MRGPFAVRQALGSLGGGLFVLADVLLAAVMGVVGLVIILPGFVRFHDDLVEDDAKDGAAGVLNLPDGGLELTAGDALVGDGEERAVADIGNHGGVDDQANGRRVHEDEVVAPAQVLHQGSEARGDEQGQGIDDLLAAGNHVEVGDVGRILNLLHGAPSGQEMGKAQDRVLAGDVIAAEKDGLSEVGIDHDDRIAQKSQALGELEADEALALVGVAAGHHDGLVLRAREDHVAGQRVDRLGGRVVKHGDIAQRHAFHRLPPLLLVKAAC